MKRKNEDAEMMRAAAEMSRLFDNPEQAKLLTAMAGVFQAAYDETELLFDGKKDCTDAEAEIIFATNLTLTEKVEALQVLRGNAVVAKKFKKFKEIATADDTIRAKAWGVKL